MGPSRAQGERKPLLPGLAELAAGGTVEAWAALWWLLARGARMCGDWIEFLPVGTCFLLLP